MQALPELGVLLRHAVKARSCAPQSASSLLPLVQGCHKPLKAIVCLLLCGVSAGAHVAQLYVILSGYTNQRLSNMLQPYVSITDPATGKDMCTCVPVTPPHGAPVCMSAHRGRGAGL